MNPIISIIVPIYKTEKYMRVCIDSILAQSFKNFELILVDDGTPDRGGEICDEYAHLDERVKVIHKENGGLSSARNAGLDIARGSYIGFVDSDDYISCDMYKRLYELSVSVGADISMCPLFSVNDYKVETKYYTGKTIVIDRGEAVQKLAQDKAIRSVAWNKLYRRSLFDGIRYPEGRYYEDVYTTFRLFDKINSLAYIDVPMYYYRKHSSAITSNPSFKGIYDLFCGYMEFSSYMEENFTESAQHTLYRLAQSVVKLLKVQMEAEDSANYSILEEVRDKSRVYEDEILAQPRLTKEDKHVLKLFFDSAAYEDIYRFLKGSYDGSFSVEIDEIKNSKARRKKVFLIGTFKSNKDFENVHVLSVIGYIKEKYAGYEFHEISFEQLKEIAESGKFKVSREDVLVFYCKVRLESHNIGEYRIRELVKRLPDNEIVLIAYNYNNKLTSVLGQNYEVEIDLNKRIYSCNKKKLTIITEEGQEEIFKNIYNSAHFENEFLFKYLPPLRNVNHESNKVLIAVFDNTIRVLKGPHRSIVTMSIFKAGYEMDFYDTELEYEFQNREEGFYNLAEKIGKYKILVTDVPEYVYIGYLLGMEVYAFECNEYNVQYICSKIKSSRVRFIKRVQDLAEVIKKNEA